MITRPQNPTKKYVVAAATIILLFGAGFLINKNLYQKSNDYTLQAPAIEKVKNSPEKIEELKESHNPIPTNLVLKVPFTPQAPTANWDELHNEACEEASAIMAYAYFNSITSLPATYVETKISELTDWQTDNYGYYLSINNKEVAKMIEQVFGLQTEIVTTSEQGIKQALADGKLVIFPANGQMLKNPNFKQPGPIYHMLVITGYDEKGFITNDPGTRRGENYFYTYDTLYESNGNWSHSDHAVDLENKQIIIVSK